jgi:cbb3-type cytochrome oxidase maturation protein
MNILLVLIPVTLLIVLVGVALFFWAVNHQQFDDLDSPAVLPLLDEPPRPDVEDDAPSVHQQDASAGDPDQGPPAR